MDAQSRRVAAQQCRRIRDLVERTYATNAFYRAKWHAAGLRSIADLRAAVASPDTFRQLPFVTKQDLLDDQARHPPRGSHLSAAPHDVVRQHQTSGTTSAALKVWDTRASWEWMTALWLQQFRALEITRADTVFMGFNFGPGLGFWNVLDAGMRMGALTLSGGGLTTRQRVESIVGNRATVVVCTPLYALHMAEVASDIGIDLAASDVRAIIAAGEPGASIPATRDRIEAAWGARLFDSPGATEVGHFGLACLHQRVHVIETEFYVEILDPDTLHPVAPDAAGELVVTNFGRPASPLIRYRTRDVARGVRDTCPCGRSLLRLDGGILGRSDDMFIVRGINVFPSAIEAIVRECGVSEYVVEVVEDHGMQALKILIETDPDVAQDGAAIARGVADAIQRRLSLKVDAEVVPPRSLPRVEGKARRVLFR